MKGVKEQTNTGESYQLPNYHSTKYTLDRLQRTNDARKAPEV